MRICDRCGTKDTDSIYVVVTRISKLFNRSLDLCLKCQKAIPELFNSWVENRKCENG